ncbi:MAG: calcium-binding protein, partial [Rhodobacteraceae bacterium]|nr:calcium-binding protein [Paracoccaceae bacterium]
MEVKVPVVNGSANNDFIHRLGDGLIPPLGATEVTDVTTGDDEILAGAGNDTLHGDAGNDTLYGGSDNDTLYGGTGDDTLHGGAGNDRYYVDSAGDVLDEAAAAGIDSVLTSINYTLGANLENLVLR